MNRRFGALAGAVLIAAVFVPGGVYSDDTPRADELLPRDAVVPVAVVTKHFPDVSQEANAGLNQTTVGNAIGSISVVFTSADGTKKVTVSVDQYADNTDATAAFQISVEGSKSAPGFKPAPPLPLGQEALAGMSQVGAEQHFGLGARDGRLIISATHAGAIPVTSENSAKLVDLSREGLINAKQVLGP